MLGFTDKSQELLPSISQLESHPSPFAVPPSSHSSFRDFMLFPQTSMQTLSSPAQVNP